MRWTPNTAPRTHPRGSLVTAGCIALSSFRAADLLERSDTFQSMNDDVQGTVTAVHHRLVLASASRSRSALLSNAGIDHVMEVSGVDEVGFDAPTPEGLVSALADAKARAVAARFTNAIVLGCDSVLAIDGRVLGKPSTARAALEHWSLIAGRTATLATGHTLLRLERGAIVAHAAGVARTDVNFGQPTVSELEAYVATAEPLASAGAFTLEGLSAPFVEAISGSPSNVIGLSLPLLGGLLREIGLSVVQFWRTPASPSDATPR
jgi:septum formation protein